MRKISILLSLIAFFCVSALRADELATTTEQLEAAKTEAQTLVTAYTGHTDGLFLPTSTALSELQTLAEAATPTDETEIQEAYDNITAKIAEFTNGTCFTLPTEGAYYYAKNNDRNNNYLRITAQTAASGDLYSTTARTLKSGASVECPRYGTNTVGYKNEIWQFEKNSSDNTWALKNLGTGTYLVYTGSGFDGSSDPYYYTLYFDNTKVGMVAFGNASTQLMHLDGSGFLIEWHNGGANWWNFTAVEASAAEALKIKAAIDKTSTEITNSVNTATECETYFGIGDDADYTAAKSTYEADKTFDNAEAMRVAAVKAVGGNIYRIVSTYYQVDDEYVMVGVEYSTDAALCTKSDNTDAGKLWQFIPAGTGYKLYNLNTKKYMQAAQTGSGSYTLLVDEANSAIYKITEAGTGYVKMTNIGGSYPIRISTSNSEGKLYLNGWNDDKAKFQMVKVKDIDVELTTVGSHSYATTYLPLNVTAVEGATLYSSTLNTADGASKLDLSEISTADAETGLILVGESGTASAKLTLGNSKTASTETALTGTLTDLTVTASSVLTLGTNANNASEVGFFKYTGTTIAANKAYLTNTGAESVALYFTDAPTTGIESIATEASDNAPVYDLTGRRVTKATKGVYIKNGQKFLAK